MTALPLLGGAWTLAVQNQSVTSRVRVDGFEYMPTALTSTDVRVVTNDVPDVVTVISGAALEPSEPSATIIQIDAQSDTAPIDTVSFLQRQGYPANTALEIRAKTGETITYNSGVATSGANKGLLLGASSRVLNSPHDRLVVYYHAGLDKWKELRYEDNA